MEILKMIDLLEDKVEQSKSIPLLNRALIDREELLTAIEEIRLNIPEDMKQARPVKEEKILSTSQALNLLRQRGYVIKDEPLPAS